MKKLSREKFEELIREYHETDSPEFKCLRLGQFIYHKTVWEHKISYEISDVKILRNIFEDYLHQLQPDH